MRCVLRKYTLPAMFEFGNIEKLTVKLNQA